MSNSDELFPNSTAGSETESANTAEVGSAPVSLSKTKVRTRTDRRFPAMPFTDAIVLAEAIQIHAAGQKVRRLTLFEKLNKSPDSSTTRQLITSSGQYGLTKGAYSAEFLELTSEGKLATGDDVSQVSRLAARFELSIKRIPAFSLLYGNFRGSKMPAREVLADNLVDAEIPSEFREECVDTFIVNAKALGLLRTIAGAERLVSIEQAMEHFPVPLSSTSINSEAKAVGVEIDSSFSLPPDLHPDAKDHLEGDFSKTCFYVTPIGDSDSESRRHADFMMEFVIRPALKEFDLCLVRADQMGQPGMIGRQVVEHILKSRLVIADLSFHNPNVFYELCLRHTTRLPTVQIKRAIDRLPFDLNQSRTISIDTSDVYGLYAMLQTHIAEVATQVRRSLQDVDSADNPISLYYPKAKLAWE
jgi:hypothetical protein